MTATLEKQYDAIVVGSGISGGWAAKELTEKGLKVLLLERGQQLEHGTDYSGEHAPSWKVPFYGKEPRELYDREYFISTHSKVLTEANRHMHNNDRDNPYLYDEKKPFYWVRGGGVGGRSLLWGRQTYRWSAQDFKANKDDGEAIAWPIGYEDIKDWYTYVEDFIGVTGQAENLPQLPDSQFLPPMEMYGIEKVIKKRLQSKLPHVPMTMGRAAILTQNHRGRAACHYCGPCQNGCSTGSYFSSQSSTLPAARATGRLTLRPDSVVEKLEYDAETQRISAVHVIDAKSRERLSFSAKLVFLCASTVGSTQIMLNSASSEFPNGLANRSGALGRYMMDHTIGMSGIALMVDKLDTYYFGNRPNGTYFPRFRNLEGKDEDADFIRGYGFQGNIVRANWNLLANTKGFGKAYKDTLSKPGPFWGFALTGFGECLPNAENRMELDEKNPDSYGIPQVRFNVSYGDNERRARVDMAKQAEKIFRAAGAVYYNTDPSTENVPGEAIHEMGTARMGDDPTQAVLNKWNQAHDVPNLFVTDGACMTSSSCVNPSLTYMALTARACDYAVKQLEQGLI